MAYITRANRLLVFDQSDPAAGWQVPAGTLETGETPEQGVLREAREESGLQALSIERFLGVAERDMSDFGHAEIYRRHFFHLICPQDTLETWQHTDPDPSVVDKDGKILPFRFHWAPMPDQVPPLIADFGYYLPELYASLARKDAT